MASRGFLTSHARVLLFIAHDPGARLRDIAAGLGITERSAHAIVTDLAEADCTVPQARDSATPIRATDAIGGSCVACARTASLDTYKRAGAMLGKALLPPKKRPEAVDALVVVTAALHVPAQILTSDPEDIRACTGTLDHADIITETIRRHTTPRMLLIASTARSSQSMLVAAGRAFPGPDGTPLSP